MTMTTAPGITAAGQRAGGRIDALDLEPVAFKLTHPDPGDTVITLAEADQAIAAYYDTPGIPQT